MPKLTSRDGQTLSYLDIGLRSAPVCLLIHGFGMQASLWLPLILPLATQYRFILPDLRGFGGSTLAQHPHDRVFETFADDLDDLLAHLDLPAVALAGYSMGGMAAMMYQQRYGTARLSAYLQIDQSPVIQNTTDWPWGLYGDKQQQTFIEFGQMFDQIKHCPEPHNWNALPKNLKRLVLNSVAQFVAGTFARPIDKKGIMALHQLGLFKSVVTHKNWPAYFHCIRQYMTQQSDLRDVFKRYDIPLWIFAGEKSELYSIHGQYRLAELVGNSTLIEFHNDGHALPFESPVKFIASLSAFIRSST